MICAISKGRLAVPGIAGFFMNYVTPQQH
jgi:hypothetical protein